MRKLAILTSFALLVVVGAPRAAALTCTFGSVTGVNFGAYDVFNASPTRATGTITYSCRNINKTNLMTMDLSTGASGTFANRTLRSGGNVLTYNLYSTAANTQVWGDGTGTTYHFVVDPSDRNSHTLTVYGTIPAGQDAAIGTYSDTITLTMNF